MPFDTVALGFGALMGLPGMMFMAKNKATVQNAIGEAKFESSVNPEMMAIASYYLL